MIVKIDPIQLTTVEGHNAELTGINPTNSDCIIGTINGSSARWNVRGMCRDHDTGCNFDTRTEEFQAIIETLKLLAPNAFS